MILFKSKSRKKGFTLIEILIVLGIIALLTSLTLVGVQQARKRAKISKAQHDIDVIYTAISQLMIDTGEWPGHQNPEEVNSTGSNEIWDLNTPEAGIVQTDGNYKNWQGPYMPAVRKDPWGNNYFFDTDYSIRADGTPCDGGSNCSDAVVVGSFGPDGQGQNLYNGDDIIKIIK